MCAQPTMNPVDHVLAEALMERACLHMKVGRFENAAPFLRTLVNEFPGYAPARDALARLERFRADQDHTDTFLRFAREFIGRHYPDQAPWLELAWRMFFDVDPSAVNRGGPAGALSVMGREKSGRTAAQVVVMLGTADRVYRKNAATAELESAVRRAGRTLGAAESLVNQLVSDLLRW